jgi:hypothetical protein
MALGINIGGVFDPEEGKKGRILGADTRKCFKETEAPTSMSQHM